MHSPTWYLSTSSSTRYLTGALAYFAQGIPKGLLHIALPAWLAVEGVAPAEIAAFLGVIMLPWAFFQENTILSISANTKSAPVLPGIRPGMPNYTNMTSWLPLEAYMAITGLGRFCWVWNIFPINTG